MPETPASPKAVRLASPGWLDTRLVLGVLLVLVSVVVGARVLSAADRTATVYAAARDLEPGATLQAGDLVPQEVRLEPAQVARLVPVPEGGPPTGYVVLRALTAGDLVLRSALVDERGTDLRQVTLQVAPGHAPPDLRSSQLVDVYVTPEQGRQAAIATSASPTPVHAGSRLVLTSVAVASAPSGEGFGGERDQAVVLNVAPADVLALVRAVAEGQVDLVRQLGRRGAPPAVPTASAAAG